MAPIIAGDAASFETVASTSAINKHGKDLGEFEEL
jgi:hypothetical protein